MEIYRNQAASVSITVPVTAYGTTMDVVAVDKGGNLLYTFSTVNAIAGGYSVDLPASLITVEREFSIVWSFDYIEDGIQKTYNQSTYVKVVTPYVTVAEIRSELNIPAGVTDTQLARSERRVRKIIDRFCGQSFGQYSSTKTIIGKGDIMLSLPEPLVSLTAINGPYLVTDVAQYEIRGEGRYLARSSTYPEGDWVFTNIIAAPDWGPSVGPDWYGNTAWQNDIRYTISGVWGWEDVPEAITEAALILIEMELCPDSEYRNRYVDDTNDGVTSLGFDSRAFSGTGNVQADQLLSDYVRTTFTVI